MTTSSSRRARPWTLSLLLTTSLFTNLSVASTSTPSYRDPYAASETRSDHQEDCCGICFEELAPDSHFAACGQCTKFLICAHCLWKTTTDAAGVHPRPRAAAPRREGDEELYRRSVRATAQRVVELFLQGEREVPHCPQCQAFWRNAGQTCAAIAATSFEPDDAGARGGSQVGDSSCGSLCCMIRSLQGVAALERWVPMWRGSALGCLTTCGTPAARAAARPFLPSWGGKTPLPPSYNPPIRMQMPLYRDSSRDDSSPCCCFLGPRPTVECEFANPWCGCLPCCGATRPATDGSDEESGSSSASVSYESAFCGTHCCGLERCGIRTDVPGGGYDAVGTRPGSDDPISYDAYRQADVARRRRELFFGAGGPFFPPSSAEAGPVFLGPGRGPGSALQPPYDRQPTLRPPSQETLLSRRHNRPGERTYADNSSSDDDGVRRSGGPPGQQQGPPEGPSVRQLTHLQTLLDFRDSPLQRCACCASLSLHALYFVLDIKPILAVCCRMDFDWRYTCGPWFDPNITGGDNPFARQHSRYWMCGPQLYSCCPWPLLWTALNCCQGLGSVVGLGALSDWQEQQQQHLSGRRHGRLVLPRNGGARGGRPGSADGAARARLSGGGVPTVTDLLVGPQARQKLGGSRTGGGESTSMHNPV